MRTIKGYVASIVVFSLSSLVNAAEISVQGSAAVPVVPDGYELSFVVEEQGQVVSKLNDAVASQLQSIIDFLKQSQIDERNIQSMQINLHPHYVSTNMGREQQGFVLSRDIKIRDTNIENFDNIIDGVIKRGADRILNFNFTMSKEQAAYEQALVAALENAISKAKLIADGSNMEVGHIVSLTESGASRPVPMMRSEMFASAPVSLPGEQAVNASVSVTFSLQSKETH